MERLGTGIESTPGVCGGEPRIAGTRINVRIIESYDARGSPKPNSSTPTRASGPPTSSTPEPLCPSILKKSSA